MNYVLVTKYHNHWDKIPENKTQYDLNLIPNREFLSNLENGSVTYFIKINPDSTKKLWKGKVNNIQVIGSQIFFEVNIEQELSWNNVFDEFNKIGWYVKDLNIIEKSQIQTPIDSNDLEYLPVFLKNMINSNNFNVFERGIHKLIKLIGVNDIYEFDAKRQAGRADGFFLLNNKLVVIYDATLDTNYLVVKKQQISNYINTLKHGQLNYYDKRTFNIFNFDKEVWIITKGISKLISIQDNVKIKEIGVNDLVRIYKERLDNQITSEILLNYLLNIQK